MPRRRYQPTSHETFSHAEVDSWAYDWTRVANPGITPKRPLKVYLPRTTQEVSDIMREVKALRDAGLCPAERPIHIRGKGHSSNDLVLTDRGAVLCTDYLNRIVELTGRMVTLESGAILAEVDAYLGRQGYGLPVIGDHNHITAGGFASVGGVSPASNRYGLFIDNVEELEYVDWNGEHVRCNRQTNEHDFHRVLAGTGQFGVITTLKCRVIPVDKRRTILENERTITRKLDRFLEVTSRIVQNPGDAVMERGVWLDVPIAGKPFVIGQCSAYHETQPSWIKSLRNRVAHGFLHGLGYVAGRLPRLLDLFVMYLGVIGVIVSPRFASIKNIEVFIDKILDSTVGDPSRMLIVFAPADRYKVIFEELYKLCREYRAKTGCFTFLSFYVKGIVSPYLSGAGSPHRPPNARTDFCELVLWLGVRPENLPEALLEKIVSDIDDFCIKQNAFRYMHTRTVTGERRAWIDPNTFWHGPREEVARASWRAAAGRR